jgi:Ser/Thr protein kinase RdoA (MazF antagonist)
MAAPAVTLAAWLDALPAARRATAETLLATVRKHLPKGYAEGMTGGMVSWTVPLGRYPAGYHCTPGQPLPFLALASTRQGLALHCFGLYCAPRQREAFVRAWKATGTRLDMGAACVRLRDGSAVPWAVLGQTLAALPVDAFVAAYEALRPASARPARATPTARTATARKATARKVTARKAKASPKAPRA